MPVRWCCLGFQGHYQSAGERSFAVLVDREPLGQPIFMLQHRTLEPGDRLPDKLNVPVTLVAEVRLNFCPWCGQYLARWYKKWIDELRNPQYRVPPL